MPPPAFCESRDSGLAPRGKRLLTRQRDLGAAVRPYLLPDYVSQRLIDPVLPARPGFLKVIENVPVNSQRDKFLGIRDRRTLRREFRGLGGCCLKRRLSRIP